MAQRHDSLSPHPNSLMDFSSGRSPATKARFVLPFSLSMHKAKTPAASKNAWSSSAPGIAKRQSQSEWLGRKTLGEYARLPKLSPTGDNLLLTNGRLSQMSAGSSRSSNNDGSVKGLFDDMEDGRDNAENSRRNERFGSADQEHFIASDLVNPLASFPHSAKLVVKNMDVPSLEASSRAAQRLASTSSPPPPPRTANLISFKEEKAEELLLVDTDCGDVTGKRRRQNGLSTVPAAANNNLSDRPTKLGHNLGTGVSSAKINGFADAKNVRPRTSLETIRQQIRQIESEIRISNTGRNIAQNDDSFEDEFVGMSRPIQASFSSQSIPANFNSCQFDSSSSSSHHQRNNNNKFYPHMQRAYSVDVAVHSAISDIQSAVRRNSMIRLKSSTSALHKSGIEEEDSVWVKRDSSAQTEMQEHPEESLAVPVAPLIPSMTPETDEEVENESGLLLSQENSVDSHTCDSRIGSLSRPVSARRPSCQSAHDLIEGVLFRCCYLGSTHLFSDSRPTKSSRLNQAQEAVARIKAPDGESQPMTDVDLFISMEKIMVLNVDIQDILMDHPLRTISYIADIGDLVVLMVKRGLEDLNCDAVLRSTQPKMLCHVFQSDEASMIAQTIGNAFQVAYMEYLKANGIQDDRYLRHLDYLEVLNSQEMSTNELDLFASKDKQTNVVIPKQKGEILGVVIVESGWGSMLPTVIIANLCPGGPAARCGKLSIGDQLISINGISLVGLPLAQCQSTIKNVKNHTVVKLTIVSCPPVVEVKIKRPDTRYQLGFSVQNGIICSLLRGGIAERGGIRVGHRIIEINSQSVVATNHEAIVNMLAHSVGEIELKTMPSSIFRLLTGQDAPVYI